MKNQNRRNAAASTIKDTNLKPKLPWNGCFGIFCRLACTLVAVSALAQVQPPNAQDHPRRSHSQRANAQAPQAQASASPAAPQGIPGCGVVQAPLVEIPEIHRGSNATLQAVVITSDEQRNLWPISGVPPCNAPYMRYFWGYPQSEDSGWWTSQLSTNQIGGQEPVPGPTLRARVGDLVEIMFLNQINPGDFSNSQDQQQCDISSNGYPGSDIFPDCIHASTTTNIHFHGTHTTPGSTGDNVLLQIFADPKLPPPTAEVLKDFSEWCEKNGSPSNWPQFLNPPSGSKIFPDRFAKNFEQNLGPPFDQRNTDVIRAGGWPQYYRGAFPYCFRLPDYDLGRVKMGQAPGTHWYHAHKHGSTDINVSNGMTGALIIEGSYDDWLNSFYGQNNLRQEVMVLQQLSVASNLKKIVIPPNFPGPAALSINGRLQPVVTMQPGQVQLWRIVNSASRDQVTLYPPAGFNWQQIAQDGVQLAFQNVQTNQPVILAAGNRADLLVQALPQSWLPNTPIAATTTIITSGGSYFGAKNSGITGSASPNFPQAKGATVNDNGITWVNLGPTLPSNTQANLLLPVNACTTLVAPAPTIASCTALGGTLTPLLAVDVQGSPVSATMPLLTAANYAWNWIAGVQTAANAVIFPLANNPGGDYFQATTGGVTGSTTPSFPLTLGATVTDGSVTWTNIGISLNWIAGKQTAVGAVIRPIPNTNPGEYFFQATTAGVTGNGPTPPNFAQAQTVGQTVTDNSVTWVNIGRPSIPRFLQDIQASEVRIRRELVFNSVLNFNAKNSPNPISPPPVVVNPNPPPLLLPAPPRNSPPANSHYINNVQFSDQRVDQAMLLDTVEEWKVMNLTAFAAGPNPWHPFHIHINPFQVIEVFNPAAVTNWSNPSAPCYVNPLDPATWAPCNPLMAPFVWWDTFAIPVAIQQLPGPVTLPPAYQQYQQFVQCSGTSTTCTITGPVTSLPPAVQPYMECTFPRNSSQSTCTLTIPGHFTMRTRFSDFPGEYVLHCHILAHEDRGMMELIEVVPNATNYHH